MYARIIGSLLIVLALVIFGAVAYRNSHKSHQPIVFSDRSMLDGLWHYHQLIYIDPQTGRTVDHDRGNSSTSEGEGYEMLRAVWWDDKAVFDRSWNWTQSALQHKSGDTLFSWYYSQLPGGNYGINTSIGAQNTASDADQDIALSLIFANDRWQNSKYLTAAKAIIGDIWNNEVVVINGKPYLAADNVEKNSTSAVIVNPSYLEPYAYRIFAKYDPGHDWNALVDTSYQVLNSAMSSKLDKTATDNLPPNWVELDRTTAAVKPTNNPSLTTEYSFDAMRVPFRIALDYAWFQDPRAKQLLSKMSFLSQQWQQNNAIYTTYGHDGSAYTKDEAPSIYSGSLGYFMTIDPAAAKQIYENKLKVLYTPDTDSWKNTLSYYDDNWTWLGMAMYNNFTINLDNPQQNNG